MIRERKGATGAEEKNNRVMVKVALGWKATEICKSAWYSWFFMVVALACLPKDVFLAEHLDQKAASCSANQDR